MPEVLVGRRRRIAFRTALLSAIFGCLLFGWMQKANAQQEPPYFVTYSSVLEEPGNLEIENQNIAAAPKNANSFFAPTVEFEYGVTAWWTAEAYLQGQTTQNDSAVFTGFRFENRFRPLPREYWINPVLYVEYEDVNKADKSFLEVTGNDSIATLQVPNAVLRKEVERSIEGKLILSSYVQGMELFGEHHLGKSCERKRAVGVWLRPGGCAPAGLGGKSEVVCDLPTKHFRGCGTIWRTGNPLHLRPEADGTIRRADDCPEYAAGLDLQIFA